MATVFEVMAKLSGNASGMVGAFKQASAAAEGYRDRVQAATRGAVNDAETQAKALTAGRGAGSGFASGFKGALAGIGVLAATVGFGAMVKEAANASDATDKFKATMNFAGLNTKAIDAAGKAAKQYADQTVYDLPTIQNMTAQLASNGVKDYTGLTKAAGNLNAVAGGNAETFKSVAMVMTQTAGAGKLTTQNWNQMADAIPGAAGPLMKAMKDAGAYTGNFRDAMEKGQITSDEFNAALMQLGTKPVAVEAAKSTKTFEGAIGSLQATINSGLMAALDKIKPAATGAITGVSNALAGLFDKFGAVYGLLSSGNFTGAFASAFHVEEDSSIVDFLLKVRDGAIQLWSGLSMGGKVREELAGQLDGVVKFGAGVRGAFDLALDAAHNFKAGLTGAVDGSAFAGIADGPLKSAALLGVGLRNAVGRIVDTFKQMGPAVAPSLASLGDSFMSILPSLMTLLSSLSPVGIALTALTPVIPVLAGAAAQLAAVLGGALAGVLQVLAPVLAGIISGLAQAVTWFMSLHGSAEALTAGIVVAVAGLTAYKAIVGTISAVTRAWAVVQGVLNAVMAVNPVTLIILGIAALIAAIVLLVMNWDNVVSFITGIWGGFIGWITGVMTGFVGFLGGIWSAIVEGVSAWLAGLFAPVVAGFTTMFAFVSGIFTSIGTFITGVWTWTFNLLMAIGAAFWAENGAQITAAWNFIVSVFTAIGAFLGSVFSAIGATIVGAWNWYVGIITGVLSAIWGVITSVFSAVWGFISSIFTTVAGFIAGVWNTILNAVRGPVMVIVGVISAWVSGAWALISGTFSRVAGFLGGIWGNIVAGVSGMVGRVGGFFSGLYGQITGALAGAGTWLLEAGRNIVQGLISGVQSLAGTIGNAFLSMIPGWIVGPFKAALGIASPSKLFKQFGRWIIEGLIIGVNQKGAAAGKAVSNVAAKMISSANQHFAKYESLMRKAQGQWGRERSVTIGNANAELNMGRQLERAAGVVRAQIRRVSALAARKAALSTQLKAAQKRLTDATTVRNKKAADVSNNLQGEFDLSAWAGYSAKDITAGAARVATRIKDFGTKIAQLKKAGLNGAMLEDVSAMGSLKGGGMADALLAGGAANIKALNASYSAITASANKTGGVVADSLYGSGIQAIKGLVGGIQKNIRSVDQAAHSIAARLTQTVKRDLGIRSPSRVFHALGSWVMKGLGLGVDQGAGDVVNSLTNTAQAMAGVKMAVPDLAVPKVPDIAKALALPTLTQEVALKFTGVSPVDAIKQFSAALRAPQDTPYAAPAVQVTVNLTAVITNPWTGEEVEVMVKDVATSAAAEVLTGTARVARNTRPGTARGY